MLYDCNRIPYRIDRRLTGLAGPDYAATISFGLPLEPEDSQYGKSRSSAHSDTKQGMRRAGKIRDVVLVYTKTNDYVWNPQYMPYMEDYLQAEYRHLSPQGRRYKETDVTAAKPGGDTEYEWYVKRPLVKKTRWIADLTDECLNPQPGWEYKAVNPYRGRYWAYSKSNLVSFWSEGRLIHRETGMPRLMQLSIARTYGPVVARVIEPPCGPVRWTIITVRFEGQPPPFGRAGPCGVTSARGSWRLL